MPWIESHSVLGRHRKIKGLARQLDISVPQAIGHIHLLWHAAIEQAEDGDLSRWSESAIAECASFEHDPKTFLLSLQENGFLDGRIIHDWLEYVGRYLTTKYKTRNKTQLSKIWRKHGKIYGREVPREALGKAQGSTTLPYLTLPNKKKDKKIPAGLTPYFHNPETALVYGYYKKRLGASSRKQDALRSIEKRLSELPAVDLIVAIARYVNHPGLEKKYVKDCANFFGEDAAYEKFLEIPITDEEREGASGILNPETEAVNA
jgi:hypothetical protein